MFDYRTCNDATAIPILARYERFAYSKKEIALYKKATGFRVRTGKKISCYISIAFGKH